MSRSDLLDPAFLGRLEQLDLVARKILSGELRGDVRTRRRGTGSLFRDHKSYTQGDDLRFLDWNVYSRLGELLIKQFDAEENLNLLILLDTSGSMDFGRENKLEFAKRVAATMGFIALNRYATVDLAILPRGAAAGGRHSFFGRNNVVPFFRVLDEVRPGGDLNLLDEFRAAVGQRRRGRGVALFVSDFFTETGYAKGLQFLRHAGYRVGAIHTLDQLDLHPDVNGRVRLVDIESGRSVRRHVSRRMLEAFESEVRSWCDGVERFCRNQDVAYVRIDTSWRLERVVTTLLLKGGILE